MASKRTSDDEKPATEAAESSALVLLRQDHREAERFFTEYKKLDGQAEKEALAVKICLALRVHTQIEEEIFYTAAREVLDSTEIIDEAIVEHAAAKQLIDEIEGMEVGDQLLDAKIKVLGEQIHHHVEEEENKLFPKLNEKLDQETIVQQMTTLNQELLAEVVEHGDAL
jgi:hemerythrin-like domain-containing protein